MWIFCFKKDQGSHGVSAASDQRLQVIFNHMCKHVHYKDAFYIQNLGAYVKPTYLDLASPNVAMKLH